MEIAFAEVRDAWNNAGGKNTGGIREWFAPPITTMWTKAIIKAADARSLQCIGGYSVRSPKKTYKIEDIAEVTEYTQGFRWNPSWHIIAARDPESSECVILDGNGRAIQVCLGLKNGTISADDEIGIIIGDLALHIVRISRAVSPLYC
jgi:hypothetical protein